MHSQPSLKRAMMMPTTRMSAITVTMSTNSDAEPAADPNETRRRMLADPVARELAGQLSERLHMQP
jgi:hypothetical protein